MHVLVVSQFFRPEPGAAQNRLGAFVDGLVARGHAVTVVCEQPNHPAGVFHPGYGRRPWMVERHGELTVQRLWVAASPRKTMPRRAAFYASFAAGAFASVLAGRRPDVALVTSPPLPPSLAAVAAARTRRTPVVLDVRDVWGIAVQAVEVGRKAALLSTIDRAERGLFARADRITAATRAFCEYIDRAVGRPVSEHIPNGVADELLALPDRPRPQDGPLVVGYAGNFGLLHDLGVLLEAADRLRAEDVRFRLVGDGPLRDELWRERERRGLESLELHPSVPAGRVGEVLMDCDVLVSPLAPHAALDAVVPSKTYDAMAVGRPVITSARGEAAALVRDNDCGIVVAPADPEALAGAIRRLVRDRALARRYGVAGRAAARAHARSRQIDRLEAVLRSAASRRTTAL